MSTFENIKINKSELVQAKPKTLSKKKNDDWLNFFGLVALDLFITIVGFGLMGASSNIATFLKITEEATKVGLSLFRTTAEVGSNLFFLKERGQWNISSILIGLTPIGGVEMLGQTKKYYTDYKMVKKLGQILKEQNAPKEQINVVERYSKQLRLKNHTNNLHKINNNEVSSFLKTQNTNFYNDVVGDFTANRLALNNKNYDKQLYKTLQNIFGVDNAKKFKLNSVKSKGYLRLKKGIGD
jgi:hypothetical protein